MEEINLLEEIVEKEIDTKVKVDGLVKAMAENTFEAIVNTGKPDRQGERINIDGVNFKNYKDNPVVLYGHDYNALPIGKAVSVRKTDQGIVAKFQLAINENPFAADIAKMIQEGYLNAVSIGVIVKEWSQDFTEIVKSEMVEFSVVPVPADQGAMILRSLGKTEDEFKSDYKNFVIKSIAEKSDKDELATHITNLKNLVALLEDTHKVSQNGEAPSNVKKIHKIILGKTAGQIVKESEKAVHIIKISLKESEVK